MTPTLSRMALRLLSPLTSGDPCLDSQGLLYLSSQFRSFSHLHREPLDYPGPRHARRFSKAEAGQDMISVLASYMEYDDVHVYCSGIIKIGCRWRRVHTDS